jgi:hypothetical protein
VERSAAFHRHAQAIVRRFEEDPSSYQLPANAFDHMACELARFQAETIPGYARLCSARRIDLQSLKLAAEIPAVPTDAFKVTRVATFPEAEARVTFRTSGTTIGARGTHAMRDPSTYRAAAVALGRLWLARDHATFPIAVLSPSPKEMPDSSLVHMFDAFSKELGEDQRATWLIDKDDVLDLSAFDEEVAKALAHDKPMLVLATSFALVHFLDALGDATFRLPRGSRVMQTGGFKGKSREVSAADLRKELSRVFVIPESAIVAEYGMTELSSQFYERTLFDLSASHGVFEAPPWARVVAVDPESLAPVKVGEIGIAKIIDLMNVDSAVAILTQDRVRRCDDDETAFELLGRMPGAPPRGCSIAIDEILGKRLS